MALGGQVASLTKPLHSLKELTELNESLLDAQSSTLLLGGGPGQGFDVSLQTLQTGSQTPTQPTQQVARYTAHKRQ